MIYRAFVFALVMLVFALAFTDDKALARIHVGVGMGSMGEDFVPLGRVVVDVFDLGIGVLAIDAEYWFIAAGSQWLFTFATFKFPVLFEPVLGVAPIISVSAQDIGLVTVAFAVKGGIGLSLGPWGLFGETILFVSPTYGFSDEPSFTLGLSLSF